MNKMVAETRQAPEVTTEVKKERPTRSPSRLWSRTSELTEAFYLALGSINQHRFQSTLTLTGIIMGIATVIVIVALIQGLDTTIKRSLSRLNPSSFIVGRLGFSDFGNPD